MYWKHDNKNSVEFSEFCILERSVSSLGAINLENEGQNGLNHAESRFLTMTAVAPLSSRLIA